MRESFGCLYIVLQILSEIKYPVDNILLFNIENIQIEIDKKKIAILF